MTRTDDWIKTFVALSFINVIKVMPSSNFEYHYTLISARKTLLLTPSDWHTNITNFVINQIIRMFLYLYYIYVRILTSLVILSFKKFINFKGRTSLNYIMTRIIYNLNRHKRVIFINHFSFSTTCRPCMM